MRWLGFAICAVIGLTLQTTVAPRLEIGDLRPNWLLCLAVFFVLHARTMDALIGAWVLGAAADVMSIERFGLLSGSYAVCTMLIYSVRAYVFRDNPLTHFAATFVAAIGVGLLETAYRLVLGRGALGGFTGALGGIVLGAAYTAAWAPPLHYVLLKIPDVLGILRPQRSYRGRRVPRGSDV